MTALLALLLLTSAPAAAAGKATLEVYVSTSAETPGARVFRLPIAAGRAEEIFFEGNPLLTGDAVTTADAVAAPGGRGEIRLSLTPDASQRLAVVTARVVGRRLGIVVNGRLVAAPVLLGPLRDGTLAVAGLSLAEAQALAPRLGPSASAVRAATSGPPDASAVKPLEGTWTVLGATLNGERIPDRKMNGGSWTFRNGTLEALNGAGEKGRFTLATEPDAPSAFRLDPVPPSPEKPVWMVFVREGSRLRLAFYDGVARRPEDFLPDRKKVILELERTPGR